MLFFKIILCDYDLYVFQNMSLAAGSPNQIYPQFWEKAVISLSFLSIPVSFIRSSKCIAGMKFLKPNLHRSREASRSVVVVRTLAGSKWHCNRKQFPSTVLCDLCRPGLRETNTTVTPQRSQRISEVERSSDRSELIQNRLCLVLCCDPLFTRWDSSSIRSHLRSIVLIFTGVNISHVR